MFDSSNGDFDIQRNHINGKGEYVVTAGLKENGIMGKTDIKAKIFEENTITIDMFGYAFYRTFKYKMVTHARVFSLKAKFQLKDSIGIFIVSTFHFLNLKFGYENMCSWVKIKDEYIHLPTKNGEIDFEFMESFVAELEAQRLTELEAYLSATGLKDYKLTDKEKQAIDKINDLFNNKPKGIEWGKYRLGDLFDSSNGDFDIQRNHINGKGEYVVTAGLKENGIMGKTDIKAKIFEENTITIDMFGYAFYRTFKYKMVTHARVFSLKAKFQLKDSIGIFIVSTFHFLNLKFGYENMCLWAKIKDEYIQLPTKNGEIDFEFMETLISAVQKLVIKDVVLYADRKIEATKQVIER